MSDINVCVVQGRLTHNPELRKTPSGASVLDFQVASNRYVPKKGQEGQFDKYTTFVRVTLWNRMADRYSEKLHTGDMVIVEGQLTDDNFKRDDGTKTSGRIKLDQIARISLIPRGEKTATSSEASTETPETAEVPVA